GSVLERHEYEYDMDILFDEVAPFVNPEGESPNPERTVNARNKDKFWTMNDSGTLTHICDYYYYYREIKDDAVEENLVGNVNVYPNPVKDILTVEASEYQNVAVYDLAGKCVMEQPVDGVLNIDMSQMEKGIYFIRMNNENGTVTRKVVVE
ncbi:MAG: T9SS type A sorting domain-containing protein, partial [Clostridia bacterium]|nr:T9SS type A sorting domain-containing protein [Clostridia bacterium]